MNLSLHARSLFQDLGGNLKNAVSASAPGRVNLIGEHTDYSGGFVLPLALEKSTHVCVSMNQGTPGELLANSAEEGEARVSLAATANNLWTDYLVGGVKIMNDLGAKISSVTVGLATDVPLGAGVSSSAALEVSLLRALRAASGIDLDDRALAYAAQRIENQHLGLKTGIMDQMASSLGAPGAPLLFDTHTGTTENLNMFSDAVFMTFHSGVSRRLVEGAYNDRRSATDLALEHLGLDRLTDVSRADIETLPDAVQPRVRHVVSENARVLAAAAALRSDSPHEFGDLMNAAHRSMRVDFEASHPQVDAQVRSALQAGALGARITGAGFGGCYVVLANRAHAPEIAQHLTQEFKEAKQVA